MGEYLPKMIFGPLELGTQQQAKVSSQRMIKALGQCSELIIARPIELHQRRIENPVKHLRWSFLWNE